MSGDVQPRKRKDKKKKKDDLGVEEPRGTAAVLGEGDVFMHSQHEHGTGGHWCAKIIFFSLLAVLVTLIGLIILENRGLTELEANSVESRYSGVLEGWLEDAPDDDHHDEHTLELLKQHDDEDDDHEHELSHEDEHDEIDHEDEDQEVSNEEHEQDHDDDEQDQQDNDDEEQDLQDDDDEEQDPQDDDDDDDQQDLREDENSEEQHIEEIDEDDDDDDELGLGDDESAEDNDNDDLQKVDENHINDDDEDNFENDQDADQSLEANDENDDDENDEEHEEPEEEEGDSEIEVEKLEKEVLDDDAISDEQPSHEVEDDDDKSQEISTEQPLEEVDDATDEVDGVEDEEFLEADDIDEPLPVVERIVAPKGKPFAEVEDEPTTSRPADTLADEEEYEKQQEELRKEQAQASHVWLKLAVGGALLVATHAVVSRAVAPRDDTPASEDHVREDTPSVIDRRMTLIAEERAAAAAPKELIEEVIRPIIEEKIVETVSPVAKSIPPPKEESEEEDIEEEEEEEEVIIAKKDVAAVKASQDIETENKELYSDEDEAEEVEEEEEEDIPEEKKVIPKQAQPEKVVEPELEEPQAEDEDMPDDVEIIDDEQIEEELEEEGEDEEEISDVDDAELLSRLEAKYGRLPEPERPGQKHKDGGNSIEDDWPGEPSDKYWRQQLDEAEQELRQGEWNAARERVSSEKLQDSGRARWLFARATDAAAEAKRDNSLLTRAIAAYLHVLKLNEGLSDARLREVAERTLDRIRFRGNYLSAEPVYRLLIRRFPENVDYRNNFTVSLLMANRADLAEEVIKETLLKWPDDRVALAHLGFILKTLHNRLEEAVAAFEKALDGDVGPATEPRFYYHLGDALLLLGRFKEAHKVHKRGAKLGHFLSPAQRSLYNVERLKSRPWWNIEQTPYLKLARALEKSWKEILKEGLEAQALYEKEKEGLKERGEWSQLDLFVRGQEVPGRCKKAPVTCSIVRSESAAVGCRRGQIKFSAMEAGTHVRPHVGPTNCRLRMHLGLSNTKDTYIRVDQETRQWQEGKVLMFDDSFEHEVWHNGTGSRLVLIVDVWHPALTAQERRSLAPI